MAAIPRQTNAVHLAGPAPVRNQVRSIPVRVDAIPEGLRVSTPLARGWARVVRTPEQLARAIGDAFTEAQVASYARWQGEAYDLDEMTDVVRDDALAAATRTQEFRRRNRTDQHNPADWTPLSGGYWRSPAGRRYRADAAVVVRVRRARRSLGIDESRDPID
jgi:hypothetical protein